MNYYNEHDASAASWLRALIRAGLIADGEVDTRSIVDVRPGDLRGFVQCHFFAGIGGWSAALRLAGWPDDRRVWTGSCPCQPWSMAGGGGGTDDPRHLWPAWRGLIRECRPPTIFGEQVSSTDGLYWLDLVYADLEASDYAVGAIDLPAASIGAPHIRQRLWFVADSNDAERGPYCGARHHERDGQDARRPQAHGESGARGEVRNAVGHTSGTRLEGFTGDGDIGNEPGRLSPIPARPTPEAGTTRGGLADANLALASDGDLQRSGRLLQPASDALVGFWSPCDWIACRDGKVRPVEPGTFPLAHGVPARVGRLRGYGNAIVPQVAQIVIGSYLDMERTE